MKRINKNKELARLKALIKAGKNTAGDLESYYFIERAIKLQIPLYDTKHVCDSKDQIICPKCKNYAFTFWGGVSYAI